MAPALCIAPVKIKLDVPVPENQPERVGKPDPDIHLRRCIRSSYDQPSRWPGTA